MKEWEILSRGTCFYLERQKTVGVKVVKNKFFLTCSHIVAPWKWPNYYSDDWLKYVNESHVKYTLDFHKRGVGTARVVFDQGPRLHPSRDLAALTITGADELQATLGAVCKTQGRPPLEPAQLLRRGRGPGPPALEDLKLSVLGYEVVEPDLFQELSESCEGTEGEVCDDKRIQVPFSTAATFKQRLGPQTFLNPSIAVSDGVCGGPVLTEANECIGMVEGAVPSSGPPGLAGAVAVVEAQELEAFVDGLPGIDDQL